MPEPRRKKSPLKKFDTQSLVSLGLGVLVVVVVGLLVFNYFKKVQRVRMPAEVEEELITELPEATPTGEKKPEKPSFEFRPTELPSEHTVAAGEHLWGLAQRYYNDGYKWVLIARANKLANPNLIHPGNKLTIPKEEAKEAKPRETLAARIERLGGKIEGDTYTVVKGDDLCKIALRAYGDCRKGWDIAKTNNLANPHIIHAGNVLKLPRE